MLAHADAHDINETKRKYWIWQHIETKNNAHYTLPMFLIVFENKEAGPNYDLGNIGKCL